MRAWFRLVEAVIVEAVRTPIGRHNGVLRDVRPDDFAALVVSEVVRPRRIVEVRTPLACSPRSSLGATPCEIRSAAGKGKRRAHAGARTSCLVVSRATTRVVPNGLRKPLGLRGPDHRSWED